MSSWGVIASTPQKKSCSLQQSSLPPRTPSRLIHQHPCFAYNPLFLSKFSSGSHKFPRFNLTCNSTGNSDNNESRTILDAFFLGKAVAEAVSERLESAVGEFLSTVGRLQAEQQKQVQEFQEEVLEKAQRAKEQAAREAMEAQGLITRSTAPDRPTVNGFKATASSVSDPVITDVSPSVSKLVDEDPLSVDED